MLSFHSQLQSRQKPGSLNQLMFQAGIKTSRTGWHALCKRVLKVRSLRVIWLRKICHVSRFYMVCWKYIASCAKRFILRPWQFLFWNSNKKCSQKSVFCLFEVPGSSSAFSEPSMHMGSLLNTKTETEGKKRQVCSKEKLEACLLQYTNSPQKAHWKPPPSKEEACIHTIHVLWDVKSIHLRIALTKITAQVGTISLCVLRMYLVQYALNNIHVKNIEKSCKFLEDKLSSLPTKMSYSKLITWRRDNVFISIRYCAEGSWNIPEQRLMSNTNQC